MSARLKTTVALASVSLACACSGGPSQTARVCSAIHADFTELSRIPTSEAPAEYPGIAAKMFAEENRVGGRLAAAIHDYASAISHAAVALGTGDREEELRADATIESASAEIDGICGK